MARVLAGNLTFVLAKMHGMRSRMYEHERLDQLLGVRNLAELMSTVAPGEEFRSHRDFERWLVARHVAELRELSSHLKSPARDATDAFLRRYQVENLKVILRGWAQHSSAEEIQPYLAQLPQEMSLPVRELLGAAGLNGFLERIPARILERRARPALARFSDAKSTFFVEAALDRAWLAELLQAAGRLKGPARAATLHLVGLEADQYQAMLVVRSRVNYDIPAEELREFLLTGPWTKITLSTLMELAAGRLAAEMIAKLKTWRGLTGVRWPDAGPGRSTEELLGAVETEFARRLCEEANSVYYRASNAGGLFGFFYLKRAELANVIRLTEALRYDIPRPDEAAKMIGRAAERA